MLTRKSIASAASLALLALVSCNVDLQEPGSSQLPVTPNRLYVGEATTCAIGADASLYCWGLNSQYAEFGVSSTLVPPSNFPVNTGQAGYVGLASGHGSSNCGISSAGDATCWGAEHAWPGWHEYGVVDYSSTVACRAWHGMEQHCDIPFVSVRCVEK